MASVCRFAKVNITFVSRLLKLNVSRRLVSTVVAEEKVPENESSQSSKETSISSKQTAVSAQEKELFEYRYVYPEFLPSREPKHRNRLREFLERKDMLKRRTAFEIPEFYVGSILAVTVADPYAPSGLNRFVGICILRQGDGMRHQFTLRNVVDHQGVEIMYDMYNPTIQKIEVLRLEKRLDDHLIYLRDALPEYSTFPFDMKAEQCAEGAPVPVNPLKVKLKPRPWYARWERMELKGVEKIDLPERFFERAQELAQPWEKYDLMKEYRKLIPEEEQLAIWKEVKEHNVSTGIEEKHRRERRRKLLEQREQIKKRK